jgi:2-amino-4-hydroxy-6-hydroxymethyldihydropteridine diphosphokinase
MQYAYLILGSNLGNKEQYIKEAISQIEKNCGKVLKTSSLYETAPWGKAEQPSFINQVLMLSTLLVPQKLLKELLAIEENLGRVRNEKFAARTIDIDILFYGRLIIKEQNLEIPHPQIPNRKFVLAPLAEIVPNKIHPILNKSVKKLLDACTDKLEVSILT